MPGPDAVAPSTSPEFQGHVDGPRAAIGWIHGIAEWFRRRGSVGRGLLALLLFTVTSILVFALPVMSDLRHRCVGSCLADTHLYVWSFEWMRYAMARGLDPFYTSLVYAPEGTSLAWVTTLPGPALLMLPFTSRFGALFSVNVLMIAAPALAGWATYLLCVQITRRYWPSIAGGLLFALSPYISQHMRAHLNLVLIFFVPLAAYLVVRRVNGSMGRIAFVILLALVLAGQFSTSLELLATLTFFGGIAYVGAFVVASKAIKIRLLWTAPLVALSYGLAAVMVSPILRNVMRQPPGEAFRVPQANSVDLLSFIVPPAPARIGGAAFQSLSDRFPGLPQDDTAYVGIVLLMIPVLFLIRYRRQLWAWALVAFMVLAGMLALGPQLHIAGRDSVWMPQALIGQLPLLQHALPERFPAYMFLALALITSIWLGQGNGARSWWRYGLVAIGLVAVSLDLAYEPHYHVVDANPPFFTEGTYRNYLEPGETVFVVPKILGGDLAWQAATGMDFRLARAYVGPVHAEGKEEVGLRVVLSEPGELLPGPGVLGYFLRERRVGAVIVEEPVQPELATLLDEVVGTPPVSVGGVSVWDVPADSAQGA